MSLLTSIFFAGFFGSNFFGIHTNGGQNWVHEFHKVLLVDFFLGLLVLFMAIKFYIDAKGDSGRSH